jgi:hypothetical protein
MADMPFTARFSLPLLATAQAQKEVTHNEALALIDALIHPTVEAGPLATPPATPIPGQCWLVAAGATGAWAGRGNALAIWSDGGWRFAAPRPGMRVLRSPDGVWLRFQGGMWIGPDSVTNPAGGVTIDSEARAAIAALILHLEAHGILISG